MHPASVRPAPRAGLAAQGAPKSFQPFSPFMSAEPLLNGKRNRLKRLTDAHLVTSLLSQNLSEAAQNVPGGPERVDPLGTPRSILNCDIRAPGMLQPSRARGKPTGNSCRQASRGITTCSLQALSRQGSPLILPTC